MSYMTFDNVWNALLKKSGALDDPQSKVEFTSENLKALLQQVYDQGEKKGQETAQINSSAGDIFGDIFRGRK